MLTVSKLSTLRGHEEWDVSADEGEDVVDAEGSEVGSAADVNLVSPDFEAGGVSLGSLDGDSWAGGAVSNCV